jgi:hypothetical protein
MATKSAFAEHLQHFFPHFRRCNQDDLGARRTVEQLAQESLNQGLSVCIDRTNFNLAWVILGLVFVFDEGGWR